MTRLPRLLFFATTVALVASCGQFPANPNTGTNGDANNETLPPVEDDSRWFLHPVEQTVQPGQRLQLTVERIDVEPGELFVTIGENTFRALAARESEDVWTVGALVTTPEAGVHEAFVGTSERRFSNTVPVRVEVPEPTRTKAETAALLSQGITATTGHFRQLVLDDENPEWQGFLDEHYSEAQRQLLDDTFTGLASLSEDAAADYQSISEEEHRAMHALLDNAGLFDLLQRMDSTDTVQPLTAGLSIGELFHRPVHETLYRLDLSAAFLANLGTAMDIVTLVSFVLGGPAASAPFAVTVVVATLQIIIDTFIPTDLVAVTEHDQRSPMFVNESVSWIYWGAFQPQAGPAGVLTSLENVVLAGLSEALPGGSKKFVRRNGKVARAEIIGFFDDKLKAMLQKVGIDLTKMDDGGVKFGTIKTILDMRIYSMSLGDVLQLTPFGAAISSWLLWAIDLDVVDALTVSEVREDWAEDATVGFAYAEDKITIRDIAYPGAQTVEEAHVTLSARAYSFENKSALAVLSVPGFNYQPVNHATSRVWSRPDPADRNHRLSDEDWIFTHVNLPDAEVERHSIGEDTTEERLYTFTFEDLFNEQGHATVFDVRVNDEIQQEGVILANGASLPVTLELEPGTHNPNEITIIPREGHLLPCANAGTRVCLEITAPGVINADKSRGVHVDVGGQATFRVWTPPAIQ